MLVTTYLNPFPNKPCCRKSLLKTLWENEKLLVKSIFSFFHNLFYSFGKLSALFNKFYVVVTCLQTLSIWMSLKFVVWEEVKRLSLPGFEHMGSFFKGKYSNRGYYCVRILQSLSWNSANYNSICFKPCFSTKLPTNTKHHKSSSDQ